jgi:hypothetical protein
VKTVSGDRKVCYIGVTRNQLWSELTVTVYNLVRMAKVLLASPETPREEVYLVNWLLAFPRCGELTTRSQRASQRDSP